MKLELKNFLISICGWISLLSVVFYIVVFKILIDEKIESSIKETLTLTLSFLSALATIGAAIIAARIFQSWKTQHSYIEQSKLLVQMVQTVDALLSALVEARQNDNLKSIFLGQNFNVPMNEAFKMQIKQAALLDTFISELSSLENQIYLLNNIKRASWVFSNDEQGNTSLKNVAVVVSRIKADISSIYDMLSINNGNGTFVISNLELNEPIIRDLILNSLFEGDKLLRNVVPDLFILDHNPVNNEINECIDELSKSILKYKDSLDTVN